MLKGINLSGGQKARVSLARAVYRNADFYVLDDPLSGLDVSVARHVFDHVIGSRGLLQHTTRIVAMNTTTFLSELDAVIVLKGL